jgi:hypothetical protein
MRKSAFVKFGTDFVKVAINTFNGEKTGMHSYLNSKRKKKENVF